MATLRCGRYDDAMKAIILLLTSWLLGSVSSLSAMPQDPVLEAAEEADQLLRVGRYQDALTLLVNTARKHPLDARAHEALAQVAQRAGHVELAEQAFRQAAQLDPENGRVRWSLGFLLYQRDRTAEATEQLARAAELLPGEAGVQQAYGLSLFAMTRFDEAVDVLQESARLDPMNAETFYLLGTASAQLPQSDPRSGGAEPALLEALRLQPAHARAHHQLGAMLLERGQPKDAIPHLEQAIAIQPSLVPAYFSLGNALIRSGKIEKGREQLELFASLEATKRERDTLSRLIQLRPNEIELRLDRARLALEQNDLPAAWTDLEATLKLDSNRAQAWTMLSELQLRRDEVNAALSSADKAYEFGGDDQNARRQKVKALLRLQRFGEARDLLVSLIERAPDDPELRLLQADAWAGLGEEEKAEAARQKAEELGGRR
ncbi:MAG: tetratricopeptide repeat protein [Planctomycetota bacterium]